MKCIHKDCVCPACGHFEQGSCWRKQRCEEIRKGRDCLGYVAECSRYEAPRPVKKEQP